eukprot:254122_1
MSFRWKNKTMNIIIILMIICALNIILIFKYESIDINENSTHIFAEDRQSPRPWRPFLFSIFNITKHLETDRLSKFPLNSDEYLQDNKIDIIYNINDVESKHKTCKDITAYGHELPIGIPSYNTSIWYKNSFISHKPNWKICYIHSFDSWVAGLSMYNHKQFYSFYQAHTITPTLRCNKNKTAKYIVNSLYFNNDKFHINIVFLITGNAVMAFSHFMLNIPIRFAMIYQYLLHLIKSSRYSQYYFNISIATYMEWHRKNKVHVWFWKQFGITQGINQIHENINITIVNVEAWCAKYSYQWFAPFIIAPFFVDINANWTDHYSNKVSFYHRQLYAWNSMHSIKHLLTNMNVKREYIIYLARRNKRKRTVRNDQQVVRYLNHSAQIHGYKFFVYECCDIYDVKYKSHFDQTKDIFSKGMMFVGPHGGAFANLVFAQFGSYVLEFNSWFGDVESDKPPDRPLFYGLSQANGLHYYYLNPKEFHYNGPMTINITQFGMVLSQIYTRIDAE